jgi:protein-tyrosine phosphatase
MTDERRGPPTAAARDRRRPDLARIIPRLLIGEYLQPDDISWLAATHAVTAIVNLQDQHDLRALEIDLHELRRAAHACGLAYHHVPVPDCEPERLMTQLDVLLALLSRLESTGSVTYLHCNAGLNRAPTVAIAYLRARVPTSLEDACAQVKARRACGPYMQLLARYFAR